MRILIVDDKAARREYFKQKYRGNDLTLVSQCQEAIKKLGAQKYDLVSLDYDIADEEKANITATGRVLNGQDVANFIIDYLAGTNQCPTRVIVHSHNVVRAAAMEDSLTQAGVRAEYDPF